jgi:hypothetical protein
MEMEGKEMIPLVLMMRRLMVQELELVQQGQEQEQEQLQETERWGRWGLEMKRSQKIICGCYFHLGEEGEGRGRRMGIWFQSTGDWFGRGTRDWIEITKTKTTTAAAGTAAGTGTAKRKRTATAAAGAGAAGEGSGRGKEESCSRRVCGRGRGRWWGLENERDVIMGGEQFTVGMGRVWERKEVLCLKGREEKKRGRKGRARKVIDRFERRP